MLSKSSLSTGSKRKSNQYTEYFNRQPALFHDVIKQGRIDTEAELSVFQNVMNNMPKPRYDESKALREMDQYVAQLRTAYPQNGSMRSLLTEYEQAITVQDKTKVFPKFDACLAKQQQVTDAIDLGQQGAYLGSQLAHVSGSQSAMKFAQGVGAVAQLAQKANQLSEAVSLMSQTSTVAAASTAMAANGAAIGGVSAVSTTAMACGVIGLGVGAISILYQLADDNDAENGLGDALFAIHSLVWEMWQDMRQHFQITWKMLGGIHNDMGHLIREVYGMNQRLEELAGICKESFKILDRKELMKTLYDIEHEPQYRLSPEERREKAKRLGEWLQIHSTSLIESSLMDDRSSVEGNVSVLSSPGFDPAAMFPYLMAQLNKVVRPLGLLPGLNLAALHRLPFHCAVLDVYTRALSHYQCKDNIQVILDQINADLVYDKTIIEGVRDNKTIWAVLLKQHAYYRHKVGRLLARCGDQINSGDATETLRVLVTGSAGRAGSAGDLGAELENELNEMELRRLLLVRLQQLTGIGTMWYEIIRLESKDQILNRPKSIYREANQHVEEPYYIQSNPLIKDIKSNDIESFKHHLLLGADVKQWERSRKVLLEVGQAIHYLIYLAPTLRENAMPMWHVLLKSTELELDTRPNRMGNLCHYGPARSTPADAIVNNQDVPLAVLWLAKGYNLPEISRASSSSPWKQEMMQHVVNHCNRAELKAAYDFYCDFEHGKRVLLPELPHQRWNICLLASMLGNLELLEYVRTTGQLDVNRLLKPDIHVRLITMAVACGQSEVVDWLIQHGAETNVGYRRFFSTISVNLIELAIEYKQFAVVSTLERHGLTVSTVQATEIATALSNTSATRAAPAAVAVTHAPIPWERNSQALRLIRAGEGSLANATRVLAELREAGDREQQEAVRQTLRSIKQGLDQIDSLVTTQVISPKQMDAFRHPWRQLMVQAGLESAEQPLFAEPGVKKAALIACNDWQTQDMCLGFSLERTIGLINQLLKYFNNLSLKPLKTKTTTSALVVVGETGVGKSTWVNACMGKKYIEDENEDGQECLIPQDLSQEEWCKTGGDGNSTTLIPNIVPSQSDYYFVDMPGNEDTRGKPEQISNGIAMQLLPNHFNELKGIVMLCSEYDFTNNPTRVSFRKTLEQVGRLLKDFPDGTQSPVIWVVTRPTGKYTVDKLLNLLRLFQNNQFSAIDSSSPENLQAMKRALSFLTQSSENIRLVDVKKDEWITPVLDRIGALTDQPIEQFNFRPASSEIRLIKTTLESIRDAKDKLTGNFKSFQAMLLQEIIHDLRSLSRESSLDVIQQEPLRKDIDETIEFIIEGLSQKLEDLSCDGDIFRANKATLVRQLLATFAELDSHKALYKSLDAIIPLFETPSLEHPSAARSPYSVFAMTSQQRLTGAAVLQGASEESQPLGQMTK